MEHGADVTAHGGDSTDEMSGPVRQPRGLRVLAIAVSVAKLAPLAVALVWLIVIQVLSRSEPVDCRDDPVCVEGQSFWLFIFMIVVAGLLIGGGLFAIQVLAAFRRSPVWLLAIGVVLVVIDLGVLGFVISDEVGHPAPPNTTAFVVIGYVSLVALGQLATTTWALARTLTGGGVAQPTGSR